MAMFRNLDIATLAVQGLSSAAAGGAQEYIWRRWASMGPIATAGFIIAGVAMKMFFRGGMLNQVSDGVFMSGASVAGWETSKKLIKYTPPTGGTVGPTAYYAAQAYNRGALPSYSPAYNAQPRMMPASPVPAPAMRMPQASLNGMNPNTGEGLLASRV